MRDRGLGFRLAAIAVAVSVLIGIGYSVIGQGGPTQPQPATVVTRCDVMRTPASLLPSVGRSSSLLLASRAECHVSPLYLTGWEPGNCTLRVQRLGNVSQATHCADSLALLFVSHPLCQLVLSLFTVLNGCFCRVGQRRGPLRHSGGRQRRACCCPGSGFLCTLVYRTHPRA